MKRRARETAGAARRADFPFSWQYAIYAYHKRQIYMLSALAADPVLKRLRAALDKLYGGRIERVVLFGSRARGEAGEDSDYDVAVFLRDLREGDLANRWRELDRLALLRCEILSDTGAFIDAKPYPAGAYRNRTVLMSEIRREGFDL